MRILVTYGSKRGGTEGLADAVADGIRQAGHDVDIQPAQSLYGLEDWDAVVVGGALYAGFWQRHARRFLKKHREQLERMPVWFFSSGPLDDSASTSDIPAPPSVASWMKRLHVHGHKTFGGRLEDEKSPLPRGDWRDFEHATAWGYRVGEEASRLPQHDRVVPTMPTRTQRAMRKLYVGLAFFTGITALIGAAELIFWPETAAWLGVSLSDLRTTPFSSFRVPGLFLLLGVALPNLAAGMLAVQRQPRAEIAGVIAGATLTLWIIAEMLLLQTRSWIEVLYLAVGLTTLIGAFWTWLSVQTRLRKAIEAVG
jgi:menaquinone-dependent protoporphyrinogen oxidase